MVYDSNLSLLSATKPKRLKLHDTVAHVDASTQGLVAVLPQGRKPWMCPDRLPIARSGMGT